MIQSYLDDSDILCDKKPIGYELAIKGNLMLIFSQLFQMRSPDITYKDKNMQKLKMVFMRWFKEMTGTAFGAYLIEYRLEKTAALLRNSNSSILEIAEQTGFENISNFNRLFKKDSR